MAFGFSAAITAQVIIPTIVDGYFAQSDPVKRSFYISDSHG